MTHFELIKIIMSGEFIVCIGSIIITLILTVFTLILTVILTIINIINYNEFQRTYYKIMPIKSIHFDKYLVELLATRIIC